MISLQICVTRSAIDLMKTDLAKSLSTVKSSHRVEALARGLQFRTYASMRALAQETEGVIATVSWQEFSGYLTAHGFCASAAHLHCVAGRVAIRAVLAKMPLLTVWGIGVGDFRRNPDGSWETAEQRREQLMQGREELMHDCAVEGFLRALSFLSQVERTKTIISSSHSYWVKHVAEQHRCSYPDGQELGPDYVSNGELIAAAVHAGFSIREYPDSLNAAFNMSRRQLAKLDSRIAA